jgi:hypothetical protein
VATVWLRSGDFVCDAGDFGVCRAGDFVGVRSAGWQM